jgi:hypothetical protein
MRPSSAIRPPTTITRTKLKHDTIVCGIYAKLFSGDNRGQYQLLDYVGGSLARFDAAGASVLMMARSRHGIPAAVSFCGDAQGPYRSVTSIVSMPLFGQLPQADHSLGLMIYWRSKIVTQSDALRTAMDRTGDFPRPCLINTLLPF